MNQERKYFLKKFTKTLDMEITDYKLLNTAFTHPTFVYEHPHDNLESNQRLEFLGDAVLGMIIAQLLYNNYPFKPEGELTKMRATLVCESSLAAVAEKLRLGTYLLLGKGEEASGGRERCSILADTLEAIFGAFFLQVDFIVLKKFINQLFLVQFARLESGCYGDFKTNLQEFVQQKFDNNVDYTIISETGPDHNKSFVAGILFQGKTIATGQGKSKKEAEQRAAQQALANTNWLKQEDHG